MVTFDLIIGLNNNLSFGQHANTEGGHVSCLLCKTFAAKRLFLQGLSMFFYDCLHIFALADLLPHLIGLNNDLSFVQYTNTERGYVPCTYLVKHLQKNAIKYGFYECLHIFALGDL